MEMILLLVAMFAIMYFLMIRPQQKKMRQDQEMRAQLKEGDRVLLTSGIFGTIAHVGERQMIIELAPGVEITILKGNVARQVTPDDEEFEFTDDAEVDAPVVEAAEVSVEGAAEGLQPSDFLIDDKSPEAGEAGYQPWDRNASGPGFEAPADEKPRTEDDK